jgi:hypothetical protein
LSSNTEILSADNLNGNRAVVNERRSNGAERPTIINIQRIECGAQQLDNCYRQTVVQNNHLTEDHSATSPQPQRERDEMRFKANEHAVNTLFTNPIPTFGTPACKIAAGLSNTPGRNRG